jgi:metal-responsive CopG/Arc/MetJ family transcriptional regulator
MWRKTLYIIEEQNRRLKERAAQIGTSRNELIRRALDRYLEKASAQHKHPDPKDRPAQS